MISATVVGRLGGDPEVKHVNGNQVLEFSVASSSYKKDGPTSWVRVSAWGDRFAKLAEYLHKGDRVAVSGRVELREWTSNGKSGTSLDLSASDVHLVETASESQGRSSSSTSSSSSPNNRHATAAPAAARTRVPF